MEKCGQSDYVSCLLGVKSGFDFDSEDAYRDVALLGTTDDSCKKLAELLGWEVNNTEPVYSPYNILSPLLNLHSLHIAS